MRKRILWSALATTLVLTATFRTQLRVAMAATTSRLSTPRTVQDRLRQYAPTVQARLRPFFAQSGVSYPPRRLTFVGLKDEARLEVYAGSSNQPLRFIRAYPILAASGGPGPKLREGDRQVPEGIYAIELLNPNSLFHLSLRVSYPNRFDRRQAARDGRTSLGGDIMIHGSNVSIGCLAMGDPAAEDLFVLAAQTGLTNITVILSPVDFRKGKTVPASAKLPVWAGALYSEIQTRLSELRRSVP